jgi:membrane-associated phospholipid phosphatase
MRSGEAILLAVALAWPLQPLDDAVRAWMRSHQQPVVRSGMEFVSKQSRPALIAATVIGLVAGPAGRACVAEGVAALVPVNLAVEGLKWTVNRTRPDGDTNRKNSSFPSSHAANAFTAAAVIVRRFAHAGPAVAIPAWVAAATVAFSRMYLDRHWLSDCLGAALLAWGGAWLAVRIMQRLGSRSGTAPIA